MTRPAEPSPLGPSALVPLGIDDEAESVYRLILAVGPVSVLDLAERVSHPRARLERILETLRDAGLLARRMGGDEYAPVDPRYALRTAMNRLSEDIQRLHNEVPALAAQFDRGQVTATETVGTRVLSDPDAIASWYSRLQHEVRHDFLAFDRPPYVTASMDPLEPVSIDRGVRWRAVYAAESFEIDGTWEEVQELLRRGEQSRVVAHLPLKLAIADGEVALISLTHDSDRVDALVTHSRPLIEALTELFEYHWARALPVGDSERRPTQLGTTPPRSPSTEERALLSLIGAGLKDETIARQLGISVRTLRRRTQDLFADLGADNRFQAGVEAARRGWV